MFKKQKQMRTFLLFQFIIFPLLTFVIYRLATGPTQFHFLCNVFGVFCPSMPLQEAILVPGMESVKHHFINMLQDSDMGSCVVVYHRGKKIIDLCGGVVDGKDIVTSLLHKNKPYTNSNLQMLFSATKAISALVVAMLVDQGHLQYHQRVSHYWKEFGTKGKEKVTVAELLQHRGGVWLIDPPIPFELLYDLDKLDTVLADQPHYFNGNSSIAAYHPISLGFYLNALVRRVDPKKRTIGEFVREEINKKLGTEVYIGVKPNEEQNVFSRLCPYYSYSNLYSFTRTVPKLFLPKWFFSLFPNVQQLEEFVWGIFKETMLNKNSPISKSYQVVNNFHYERNDLETLKPECPACSGLSNAASLALIASVLSQGGSPLLSEKSLIEAMRLEKPIFDQGMCTEVNRTRVGWAKFDIEGSIGFGWPGFGGAHMLWNTDEHVGFGYVTNSGEEQAGMRGFHLFHTVMQAIKNL